MSTSSLIIVEDQQKKITMLIRYEYQKHEEQIGAWPWTIFGRQGAYQSAAYKRRDLCK